MTNGSIHPLLAVTGEFLELLANFPRVAASDLRALAAQLGRWGGTIVELEAWRREPAGFDEGALEDLIGRTDRLFDEARGYWQLLQVACLAGGGVARVAAKAGFDSEAITARFEARLNTIAEGGEAFAFGAALSRYLLLEGLYDARGTSIDHEVLLNPRERELKAEAMLDFLSKRLDPAAEERKASFALNPTLAASEERARIEIAQEHRRLSWETSRIAERDGEKPDHPARWIDLSKRYEAQGDKANAAGALSNGLERVLEVWERSKRPELEDAARELIGPLRLAVGELADDLARDIRKVIARASLALGQRNEAAETVSVEVSATAAALKVAKNDVFRRSYLLRDADDWLALAAVARPELALEFRAALRPDCAPIELESSGTTRFLYPILGRQRAGFILYDNEQLKFLEVTSAHDLARTLDALHRLAKRDINDYKVGTLTEKDWRELLARIAGMLRVHELKEWLADADVVLLLEGSTVHLPWPAVFLAADVRCKSVELCLLQQSKTTVRAPSEPATSRVTANTFRRLPKAEQWHNALEELSTKLGATSHGWDSLPEARMHDLALVGAHGVRQMFGALSVDVGDNQTRMPATTFVDRVPIGRTTFCGICFAGGGFLSGSGEWDSMPGLLLTRGAERVVANAWPAWDVEEKRTSLAKLIGDVHQAPSTRDAATAVLEWQRRAANEHPRWWSGWGLWTVGGAKRAK